MWFKHAGYETPIYIFTSTPAVQGKARFKKGNGANFLSSGSENEQIFLSGFENEKIHVLPEARASS